MDNFKSKFEFGKLGQGSLDEFMNFKSKKFFSKVFKDKNINIYIYMVKYPLMKEQIHKYKDDWVILRFDEKDLNWRKN